MADVIVTPFGSILLLSLQPFIGALCSGIFVISALLVGLILRLPKIKDLWRKANWWVLLISAASIGIMIFHAKLGLQTKFFDSDINKEVIIMSPVALAICYFLAIFPIVNFPRRN